MIHRQRDHEGRARASGALLFSLLVHFLLLCAAKLTEMQLPLPPGSTTTEIPGSALDIERIESTKAITGSNIPLHKIVKQQLQSFQKLSPQQRAELMKRYMEQVQSVSPRSLKEISKMLGSPRRALRPVTPPPPGPFDVTTAIVYMMDRRPDGSYTLTLVDKDGRTLHVTMKEQEMPPDTKQAYKVFLLMKKIPPLHELYLKMMARFMPGLKPPSFVKDPSSGHRKGSSSPPRHLLPPP